MNEPVVLDAEYLEDCNVPGELISIFNEVYRDANETCRRRPLELKPYLEVLPIMFCCRWPTNWWS